jgi:hypothetical protein
MLRWFRRKHPVQVQRSPFDDETTIGNILMRMRVLTKDQLVVAIGRKAHHDEMLLGALLRELGFVTDEQVAKALLIQAKLRKGDAADAAMELMEMRLEAFGKREDQLTEEISHSREEHRGNGDPSGLWLLPAVSGMAK